MKLAIRPAKRETLEKCLPEWSRRAGIADKFNDVGTFPKFNRVLNVKPNCGALTEWHYRLSGTLEKFKGLRSGIGSKTFPKCIWGFNSNYASYLNLP
jgi:hypothetical protein